MSARLIPLFFSAFQIVLVATLVPATVHAHGEGDANGFPNWNERVLHEWTNRARCDPQYEMMRCPGTNCGEMACYTPVAPLPYSLPLNRAARFHSDAMDRQSFFAHNSACTLVSNIDALYPTSCNGVATCACVGGVKACMPTCTSFSARIALFGTGAAGEIIASSSEPNQSFYLWLFEPAPDPACMFTLQNGHRWNILKSGPNVGYGVGNNLGGPAVGDFGGGGQAYRIPSGSHYPRQAAQVEVWANWSDAAAPQQALVNVGGTCSPLTRMRGSPTNGAWSAMVSGVGTGCHRYFFSFKDASGAVFTYPSTGSLGIGPAGSCADWDSSRPATGAGCNCAPMCTGKMCGDDGCGGSCGGCGPGQSCQGGTCVGGPVDMAVSSRPDLSRPRDASVPRDGGAPSSDDGATDDDGGTVDSLSGGCSCQLGAARGRDDGSAALALVLVALLLHRRRR